MRSKLPQPDVHLIYQHKDFNDLLTSFNEEISKWVKHPLKEPTISVVLDAEVAGSDIKMNDMAGTLKAEVQDDGKFCLNLFSCNLVHFTGNCGIKAMDHLSFFQLPATKDKHKDDYSKMLSIIESFAWHKTNCGFLIGSDTCAKGYKGATLMNIEQYGTNYHVSKPTWNPNYTWSKDHKVVYFDKDLNSVKHVDYWGQVKATPLKGASQEVSAQLHYG